VERKGNMYYALSSNILFNDICLKHYYYYLFSLPPMIIVLLLSQ
jgi:hypothetical protein